MYACVPQKPMRALVRGMGPLQSTKMERLSCVGKMHLHICEGLHVVVVVVMGSDAGELTPLYSSVLGKDEEEGVDGEADSPDEEVRRSPGGHRKTDRKR
jgi:hypothetical protein